MVEAIHDFSSKLLQPKALTLLQRYVVWQAAMRQSSTPEKVLMPEMAPISINLDPTSACNFRCDHCVDEEILNTGKQYHFGKLQESLDLMHERGLQSVIIIGGGEPTLYKQFGNLVTFLKEREIQIGIVSNGTRLEKVLEVAQHFTEGDWLRLSLDSGTEETFQQMHKPKGKMIQLSSKKRVPISLEQICQNITFLQTQRPNLSLGFSYIVTWPGARTNNKGIALNIEEMPQAATLARDSGFDYISFKAFLDRTEGDCRSEVVGIKKENDHYTTTVASIRKAVRTAQEIGTSDFKTIIATNLRALLTETEGDYKNQPKQCHMTALRQVMGLEGLAICPVYREVESIRIGTQDAYLPGEFVATLARTAERIRTFDAQKTCKDVVCMYNAVNWAIEGFIREEIRELGSVAKLQPNLNGKDYFL